MSETALSHLLGELKNQGFEQFTLRRLLNENPPFAHLANHVGQHFKSKYGTPGYHVASFVFACAYRAIELSHRYPEKPSLLLDDLSDILESAAETDRLAAEEEWKELLSRL